MFEELEILFGQCSMNVETYRGIGDTIGKIKREYNHRGLVLATLCDMVLGEGAEDHSDDALIRRARQLVNIEKAQGEEIDQFNAGYKAFQDGKLLQPAEIVYGWQLEADGKTNQDSFSCGYAWAKFVEETK